MGSHHWWHDQVDLGQHSFTLALDDHRILCLFLRITLQWTVSSTSSQASQRRIVTKFIDRKD